jgi:hypothetical protein
LILIFRPLAHTVCSFAVKHDSCSVGSGIHPPVADKTHSLDEPIQSGNMKNDKPAALEPSIKTEVRDLTPQCTSLPMASMPPANTSSLATAMNTTAVALQSPVEPIQSVKMKNVEPSIPEPITEAEVMDDTEPSTEAEEPSIEAEVMDVPEPSIKEVVMDVVEPSIKEQVMDVPQPSIKEPSIKEEAMDSTPEHASLPLASRPPINLAAATTAMPFPSDGCGQSMSTNRIKVYPRRPDLVFPEGVTVLPFSDDQWVAVSIPFSQQ